MRTIEVDFNDIARNGKIKVWRDDARGASSVERVLLVERAEGMAREATLSEVDGDWAYFELTPRPLIESASLPGIFVANVSPVWWVRSDKPVIEPSNVGVSSRKLQDA